MHTLAEVNRIKHLDFVALLFLQEMAYLGEYPTFRIYAHIRRMGLKELRGQPEPGLARAGRADNTAVEVAGVGRDFWPGVHGEKFRPGQYHVVFKLWVNEGSYILCRPPAGRTIFHVFSEFLCVPYFVVDYQPEHHGPNQAHQQIEAVARSYRPEGWAYGFHHAYELHAKVGPSRKAVRLPDFAEEPEY